MRRRQRLALKVPCDPSPAPGHVREREVGGVPGVRKRQDMGRSGQWLRRLQEGVNRDAAEIDSELRPGRNAMYIPVERGWLEGVDLLPAPRHRLSHQTLDLEGPRCQIQLRCYLSREDRPVLSHVVLSWR